MIIDNLNFERITISPCETDAILIIDADTMLTLPITLQGFEMITGKDRQIPKLMSSMYVFEFSLRHSGDPLKPARALAIK
jgi:hypothetical protein